MDNTITQEQFDALKADVAKAAVTIDTLTKAVEQEKARTSTAEAALKTANEELAKHAPAKSDLEKRLDAMPEEIAKGFRAEIAALQKDVNESRELREVAKFEKMAMDDYPNLPGRENGRILKAIHGLPDEDVRKAALELFKGANEAYRLMFKEQGRSHVGAHSATADLEHRAKELMKADPSLSYHQAVLKVGDSDPVLTERLYEEQRERPRA